MLGDLLRWWRLSRQRARDRRLLAQFTNRDLRDLGLARGDVWRELTLHKASPAVIPESMDAARWSNVRGNAVAGAHREASRPVLT